MRHAIKFSALAVLLTATALVVPVYPYGQFMGDVSGVVVDEEWDLSAVLSNRTPGDGRTIIMHFASGTNADRKAAIRAAHDTWEGITAVDFDDTQAFEPSGGFNVGDDFNTHSFDVNIGGGGVLAFTPNVTVVSTGQILESDVYYNRIVRWDTSGNLRGNRVDVESVAFHESGHVIALSHTGVSDATMFPAIQAGIESRTPEPDDEISPVLIYGRDTGDVPFATGGISGHIIDGNDANDGKVCALVFAFSTSEEPITVFDQAFAQNYSGSVVGDTVANNTSGPTSGSYEILGLPDGDYMVFLVPTGDGLINANQINNLCASHAEAGFPREFWNGANESNNEADTFERVSVTVSGGLITTGIDIITETGAPGCVVDADCPAGQTCCAGACVMPVCSTNADCDDAVACTTDICTDPGTCDAACSNTFPACGIADSCCAPTCTPGNDPDCPCGAKKDPCNVDADCCSSACKRNGRCR